MFLRAPWTQRSDLARVLRWGRCLANGGSRDGCVLTSGREADMNQSSPEGHRQTGLTRLLKGDGEGAPCFPCYLKPQFQGSYDGLRCPPLKQHGYNHVHTMPNHPVPYPKYWQPLDTTPPLQVLNHLLIRTGTGLQTWVIASRPSLLEMVLSPAGWLWTAWQILWEVCQQAPVPPHPQRGRCLLTFH